MQISNFYSSNAHAYSGFSTSAKLTRWEWIIFSSAYGPFRFLLCEKKVLCPFFFPLLVINSEGCKDVFYVLDASPLSWCAENVPILAHCFTVWTSIWLLMSKMWSSLPVFLFVNCAYCKKLLPAPPNKYSMSFSFFIHVNILFFTSRDNSEVLS